MSFNFWEKRKIIFIVLGSLLFFYLGYKTAICFRYNVQKKMLPEEVMDKYSVIFNHDKHTSVYWECYKRYLISSKEEFQKYQMETFFNLETKPFMKWFIDHEPEKSFILDIGGATGIQWKIFQDIVMDRQFKVALVDIDKNSLQIGIKKNKFKGIEFYHLNEIHKIKNAKIDTILLCEVYMQIPEAAKVLKSYVEKYPSAKVVIIHSVFQNTFFTKILSFVKKYILKFIPMVDCLYGRAMTDELLYSEINNVDLEVIKEYDLTHLSKHKRPFNSKVKAYIIKRNSK